MMTDPKPAEAANTNITEQAPAPPLPPASEPAPPAPAAPAIDAAPPGWMLKADFLLLGLLLVLSFLLASFTATNSDNWLQLAIGRLISEGKFTFGVDPFSWATDGVYWVHHSWLYSLLLYQFHNLAGATGLIVGKAILFTAAIALLCCIGWNAANRWFLLVCLLIAALAVSGRLVLEPRVVSYLFLAITLFVLYRAGVFAQPRAPAGSENSPDTLVGPTESAPPASERCLWWLPPLFLLWANLDAWFILGPIVVGLCWAGTGLGKWFRSTGAVPGKALGVVFGVGLLACVVNPHHVRIFQLPPELAYVVLSLTDPFNLPLPGELIAAGRTMRELQKADINIPWTANSLSSAYWQDPAAGFNVAGLAVYPLLVMGVLGFGVAAVVRPLPNAPTLHVGRFLVWLFFAILALALYRLIPFFALVAAPLTAMTLGEFLDWQLATSGVPIAQRGRGLRLARILSLPVALVLIGLAWPGWLHGPRDLYAHSSRRVAWDMTPDPSLQRAAEALRAVDDGKHQLKVFNGAVELGNYLPWFAPGLKHHLDTRFALHVGQASKYAAIKKALPDTHTPADEWQDLFVKHGIDQVAMDSLVLVAEPRIFRWWSNPDQWRQRHADTRIFVFSWAGPQKSWPVNTSHDDANAQAFGDVPVTHRPPPRGMKPVQIPTDWTRYLDGIGLQPAGPTEVRARQLYLLMHNQYQPMYGLMTNRGQGKAGPTPSCSLVAFSASLANLQAIPGGGFTLAPSVATLVNDWTMFRPRDFAPPAVPVLMVRAARLAVAENPLNAESHVALTNATEVLRSLQEDYWINHQRPPHPSALRETLRQTQLATGRYRAAELQPNNYEYQIKLAEIYMQQNWPDLALERLLFAEQAAEARLALGKELILPSGEAINPKIKDKFLKSYHQNMVEPLEKNVRQRLARFEEIKGSPLERAVKAVHGEYQDFNQGRPHQTSLGLVKKAMELLDAIDPSVLKEQETDTYLRIMFDLNLGTGRVDRIANELGKAQGLKRQLPGVFASYQFVTSGVLGDYKIMQDSLETLEDGLRDRVKAITAEMDKPRNVLVSVVFATGTQASRPGLIVNAGIFTAPALMGFSQGYGQILQAKNELGNIITLRGITALEAGDTKQAREFFKTALAEDEKSFPFADRPIARRYLELIEQQSKR